MANPQETENQVTLDEVEKVVADKVAATLNSNSNILGSNALMNAAIFRPTIHTRKIVMTRKKQTPSEKKKKKPGKPDHVIEVQWEAPDALDIMKMLGNVDIPLPIFQRVARDIKSSEEAITQDELDQIAAKDTGILVHFMPMINDVIAASLIIPQIIPDDEVPNYEYGQIHKKDLKKIPISERANFTNDIFVEAGLGAMFRKEQG